MMVIEGSAAATVGPYTAGTTYIFPADRCTWTQSQTNVHYEIANAVFHFGGSTGAGAGTSANVVSIDSPELGYIGKSGRFVRITQ